jgi:hypothetical protein
MPRASESLTPTNATVAASSVATLDRTGKLRLVTCLAEKLPYLASKATDHLTRINLVVWPQCEGRRLSSKH